MIQVVNLNTYDGDDLAIISRPSPLGNPYCHKPSVFPWVQRVPTVEIAVDKYRTYLYNKLRRKDRVITYELKLLLLYYNQKGSIALGCHCKDKHGEGLCHGDVIKEIMERYIQLTNSKRGNKC